MTTTTTKNYKSDGRQRYRDRTMNVKEDNDANGKCGERPELILILLIMSALILIHSRGEMIMIEYYVELFLAGSVLFLAGG